MINQFVDCNDSSNIFRFSNLSFELTIGDVYFIQNSLDFSGCATVITNNGGGPQYDATGAILTLTSGCSDSMCPTPIVSLEEMPMLFEAPSGCEYDVFCFRTSLPSLSGFSGNYTEGSLYNDAPTYSGDGTTDGVIYYYSSSTETYWCLSDTLGGTCYLQGASPCYSNCPDISANDFISGICPTPTPTPANCSPFNFEAYFDCDWEPLPTPTPSVDCNDVEFIYNTFDLTPTPTPSGNFCENVGLSFSLSGYTPASTPTATPTPTVTITKTVGVQGQVTFNMLDDSFQCVSVKVLIDCNTGVEYYVNDNLIFNGIVVVVGMTLFMSINNVYVCATYDRDDSDFSSNSIVDEIFQIYTICGNCDIQPSPTPTPTSTPTPTMTPTASITPTITPTQTMTPTQSPSQGASPSNTPTQTPTMTPTMTMTSTSTPTPTPTPNYVYVFQTCQPSLFSTQNTQMIQTQPHGSLSVGQVVKEGIFSTCWSYLGRFEYDYIAPPNVISSTFNGDYFSSVNVNGVFSDCTSCLTPVVPTVQEKYLYESCNVISGNVYKTQVVQTIQHPGVTKIGQTIKTPGILGNCFEYLGTVSTSYVIPGNYIPVEFNGDYFASTSIFDDTVVYSNCSVCNDSNQINIDFGIFTPGGGGR
jgi:hypothetical protein